MELTFEGVWTNNRWTITGISYCSRGARRCQGGFNVKGGSGVVHFENIVLSSINPEDVEKWAALPENAKHVKKTALKKFLALYQK